jgi:hypothetical protein
MDTLVSLIKADFTTIRQLEKKGYKLFAYAGGMFVVGLILTFTSILAFIGVPLLAAGVGLFFISMLWMMKLGKRPVWDIFCPYCSGKNEVFKTVQRFDCDLCNRGIIVDAHGQAEPTEPVERVESY